MHIEPFGYHELSWLSKQSKLVTCDMRHACPFQHWLSASAHVIALFTEVLFTDTLVSSMLNAAMAQADIISCLSPNYVYLSYCNYC